MQVAFADGNCVCLRSEASGRYLSVSASGNVTGVGNETDENCELPSLSVRIHVIVCYSSLAKFYVRTTNEGSLLLQTATDSRKYLSISDDHLDCNVSEQ